MTPRKYKKLRSQLKKIDRLRQMQIQQEEKKYAQEHARVNLQATSVGDEVEKIPSTLIPYEGNDLIAKMLVMFSNKQVVEIEGGGLDEVLSDDISIVMRIRIALIVFKAICLLLVHAVMVAISLSIFCLHYWYFPVVEDSATLVSWLTLSCLIVSSMVNYFSDLIFFQFKRFSQYKEIYCNNRIAGTDVSDINDHLKLIPYSSLAELSQSIGVLAFGMAVVCYLIETTVTPTDAGASMMKVIDLVREMPFTNFIILGVLLPILILFTVLWRKILSFIDVKIHQKFANLLLDFLTFPDEKGFRLECRMSEVENAEYINFFKLRLIEFDRKKSFEIKEGTEKSNLIKQVLVKHAHSSRLHFYFLANGIQCTLNISHGQPEQKNFQGLKDDLNMLYFVFEKILAKAEKFIGQLEGDLCVRYAIEVQPTVQLKLIITDLDEYVNEKLVESLSDSVFQHQYEHGEFSIEVNEDFKWVKLNGILKQIVDDRQVADERKIQPENEIVVGGDIGFQPAKLSNKRKLWLPVLFTQPAREASFKPGLLVWELGGANIHYLPSGPLVYKENMNYRHFIDSFVDLGPDGHGHHHYAIIPEVNNVGEDYIERFAREVYGKRQIRFHGTGIRIKNNSQVEINISRDDRVTALTAVKRIGGVDHILFYFSDHVTNSHTTKLNQRFIGR